MRAQDHPNHTPGVPMLMPPWLERLQIRYMNPLMAKLAPRLPGFATVVHVGRSSGTTYETTVNAVITDDLVAIGLIHGQTNWVKNVLAAGGAELRVRDRRITLTAPRVVERGTEDGSLPARLRPLARRAGVFIADIG